MKVVVAHPGKQFSDHLAFAFHSKGLLYKYFLSFMFEEGSCSSRLFKMLPGFLKQKLKPILLKRTNQKYAFKDKVFEVPWFEPFTWWISRFFKSTFLSKYFYFFSDRLFDVFVSKVIKKYEFDFFVGYENSCLECFKVCKKNKVKCVLDLAGVHFVHQKIHRERYGYFKDIIDDLFYTQINKIKSRELELADLILVPSNFSKDILIDNDVKRDKIKVVQLGINMPRSMDVKKYDLSHDLPLNLVFVGTLSKRKGVYELVEAFSKIKINKINLNLIGYFNKDVEKDLLLKSKEINIVGHVSNDQLFKHLAKNDVFILPSLEDSFGLVVLEAMACGLPVIVTENVGAKDIVIDGYNGFVIKAKDEEAIKEKIMYFYNNREKIEEIGLNARKTAEKYTWELYRENVVKAILE